MYRVLAAALLSHQIDAEKRSSLVKRDWETEIQVKETYYAPECKDLPKKPYLFSVQRSHQQDSPLSLREFLHSLDPLTVFCSLSKADLVRDPQPGQKFPPEHTKELMSIFANRIWVYRVGLVVVSVRTDDDAYCLFLSVQRTHSLYNVGLVVVSVRTNKRHHHH